MGATFDLTTTEIAFIERVQAIIAAKGYKLRYDTYTNYYNPKSRNVGVVIHWSHRTCQTGVITEQELASSTPEAVAERLLSRPA